MRGTGIPIPGYSPDVARTIPEGEDIECYAPDCGERASAVSLTPFGKGAWCDEHAEDVLPLVGPSGGTAPGPEWLVHAFAPPAEPEP